MKKIVYSIKEKNYSKEELNKISQIILESYPFKGKVLIIVGIKENLNLTKTLYLHMKKKGLDVNVLLINNISYNKEKNYLNI